MKRHLIVRFAHQTVFFLLFVCGNFSEAQHNGNAECISGENYCTMPDVCAYVFTFSKSEDGRCPAVDRAVYKVDDMEDDVGLLYERFRLTNRVIETVKEEQDDTRQLIYQQSEVVTDLRKTVEMSCYEAESAVSQLQDQIENLGTKNAQLQEQVLSLKYKLESKTLALMSTDTKISVPDTLPELTALTSCIWTKSKSSGRSESLVSYAVVGSDNEFLLYDSRRLRIHIKSEAVQTSLSLDDGRWHHVCVTWSSDEGIWKCYHNGALFSSGTGLKSGQPITGGGSLMLGQDQDTVGGGFSADQAHLGKLTEFNLWQTVLSDEEIYEVSKNCSVKGDLVAFDVADLYFQGDVYVLTESACSEQ